MTNKRASTKLFKGNFNLILDGPNFTCKFLLKLVLNIKTLESEEMMAQIHKMMLCMIWAIYGESCENNKCFDMGHFQLFDQHPIFRDYL